MVCRGGVSGMDRKSFLIVKVGRGLLWVMGCGISPSIRLSIWKMEGDVVAGTGFGRIMGSVWDLRA